MQELGPVNRLPETQLQSQATLGRIVREQAREDPDHGRVDLRATPGAQPVSSDGHAEAAPGRVFDVTG